MAQKFENEDVFTSLHTSLLTTPNASAQPKNSCKLSQTPPPTRSWGVNNLKRHHPTKKEKYSEFCNHVLAKAKALDTPLFLTTFTC
jgi:hypothetical protein